MPEMDVEVFVLPDGTVNFLYYDELKPLLGIGDVEVARASHVDPEKTADGLKWFADLSPCGHAVKLGPFETRADAIKAEVAYLIQNVLPFKDDSTSDL